MEEILKKQQNWRVLAGTGTYWRVLAGTGAYWRLKFLKKLNEALVEQFAKVLVKGGGGKSQMKKRSGFARSA